MTWTTEKAPPDVLQAEWRLHGALAEFGAALDRAIAAAPDDPRGVVDALVYRAAELLASFPEDAQAESHLYEVIRTMIEVFEAKRAGRRRVQAGPPRARPPPTLQPLARSRGRPGKSTSDPLSIHRNCLSNSVNGGER
jgi:hypothetical protein